MGNKKKTAVSTAKSDKPVNNQPAKLDGTKIFLIVFACVALVGIITALVIGIVSHLNSQPVDYMNDRLGKYVKISAEDYENYDVLINLDPVTDMSVENEIIKLLYKNRKETDNKNKIDQTIKVGDTANIYYYGYTLGENGEKQPFSGGSNLSGTTSTALGIGSGSMIPGFELALVGKNSADYSKLTKRTDGVVGEGNIVYITYSVMGYDGGAEKDSTMVVDLSEDVDAKYGKGFKDFLLGATVGKEITKDGKDFVIVDKVVNGVTKSDTYSDVTVNSVIEFSDAPTLTIEVTFPRPYTSAPELEGKTVFFDIYIMTSVSYDTPEFNDEFITETLKVTEEELAGYNGTLTEKYTAKIRADLEATYKASVNTAIEEAFWDHIRSTMTVKKLPKAEVESFYRSYYNDVVSYYTTYQSYYSSFDEAARTYLGISSSESWEDALRANAENAVKEKLAFYYIAREGDMFPSGETYDKLYAEQYQEMLDAYLEQYNIVREDFDTDEEYEEKVQYYRDLINAQYGDAYFRETVYFDYAMEIIRSFANLTYAE